MFELAFAMWMLMLSHDEIQNLCCSKVPDFWRARVYLESLQKVYKNTLDK